MSKLADSLGKGALWRPGEDPPDCYLEIGGKVIAVEISTLPQLVTDDRGKSVPRDSLDMRAVRICNKLDAELSHSLPKGTAVSLILEAPIKKPRRFERELSNLITTLVQDAQNARFTVKQEILSNSVTIEISKNDRSSRKKITGTITNRRSSPLIFANAKRTLDERIRIKEEKRKSHDFAGPVWLALLADYWLPPSDTYKDAIKESDVKHGFERIFLVYDDGTVVSLF